MSDNIIINAAKPGLNEEDRTCSNTTVVLVPGKKDNVDLQVLKRVRIEAHNKFMYSKGIGNKEHKADNKEKQQKKDDENKSISQKVENDEKSAARKLCKHYPDCKYGDKCKFIHKEKEEFCQLLLDTPQINNKVKIDWMEVCECPLAVYDDSIHSRSILWNIFGCEKFLDYLRPKNNGIISIETVNFSHSTQHPTSISTYVDLHPKLFYLDLPLWVNKLYGHEKYLTKAGFNAISIVKIYPHLLELILREKGGVNVCEDSIRFFNDAYLRDFKGRIEYGWNTVRVAVQILAYQLWLSKHFVPANLKFQMPELSSRQL